MGYDNPLININQTNAAINQQVKRFNDEFNEEFDAINAQQAANIEANMDILEQQQKKRALGDELWYQQVEKYRPKGGYAKDTKAFLHNMHNKYYELLGCETMECREQLENLKNVPRQLSEVGGAWTGMHEKYEAAGGKKLFSPGSLNARTPNYVMQVMENGGTTKKVYNDETGHVEFEVYDGKGNRVMELGPDGKPTKNPLKVDAVEFTKGALNGDITVNTYGDPASLRQEFQAGIAKDMDYNSYVQKITDNQNQYDKKGYEDYSEANNLYKQNLANSNANALMDDKKGMTDNYPVIVNGLFEQAKEGDPAALAALEKLDKQTGGKILGGDGLGGNNDLDLSSGLAVQSAIGMWENTDVQREAANAYFKYYDKSSNLLKPDRIDKTRTMSSPSASERRAQYNFNQKVKNDQAKLLNATNEAQFVKDFDDMMAGAKTEQDVFDVLETLGNFDMGDSSDGKNSITYFVENKLLRPQINEDGSVEMMLYGPTKTDKNGDVTGGELRMQFNLSDPQQMKEFRDKFKINSKTFTMKNKPDNTKTDDNNNSNPLNAANFNSKQNNANTDTQPEAGSGVLRNDGKTSTNEPSKIIRDNNAKLGSINNAISGPDPVKDAVEGQYYRNDSKGSPDFGTIYQFKNGKYTKVGMEKKSDNVTPPAETPTEKPTPVVKEEVEEVVEEKPTKVSYGQPKDISDDRVDKVADRILTWERASGSGVNAGPHTDFGFNSGTKPKTKKEAMARFEKEYGKNFVSGLNDEALFQAVDWKFNAGRNPKHMLLFAAGLIPGTPSEQRMRVNSKDPKYSDAVLDKMYKDNEKAIVAFANSNDMRLKKMELYLSPKMVKSGDYTKEQMKTGLQKQWGPRMGLSEAEINKWIDANFETIYNESLNS